MSETVDDEDAPRPWWRTVVDFLHDEFWWPRKMSRERLLGLVAMSAVAWASVASLGWASSQGDVDGAGSLFGTTLVAAFWVGLLVATADYEDDDPE